MGSGLAIPVHLTVHVLGLTVAVGLIGAALVRRHTVGPTWFGLVLGGILLAASHVATGALVVGDAGWPIYVRATAYAAIAVGAAGRLAGDGAHVVFAVAPPSAHIAAAVAAAFAGFAALRGALGRGRQVLPLAAGLLLWGASDLAIRTSAPLAAVLSVAGSVATGAWVLRRARASLLTRSMAAFTAVLLVLAVGFASIAGFVFSLDLEREQLDRLGGLAEAQATQYETTYPRLLTAPASVFAEQFADANFTGGTRTSRDLVAGVITTIGVPIVILLDEAGRVVGAWSQTAPPPAAGSALAEAATASGVEVGGPISEVEATALAGSEPARFALEAGDQRSGLVVLGDRHLLAVTAVPITDPPAVADVRGAVLAARTITSTAEIEALRTAANVDDAALMVDGEIAATTLESAAADDLATALGRSERSEVVDLGGERSFVATAPLTGPNGTVVGTVAVVLEAGAIAGLQDQVTRAMFGAAAVALLVAGGLAAFAANRTTRPVRRLTAAAERIAAGDLTVRVHADREDEVGRLAAAFDEMTAAVAQREDALRTAATTEGGLRSRLEAVTASMGEALLAVDTDGIITTANPAAGELLGMAHTDFPGLHVRDVVAGVAADGAPLPDALDDGDRPVVLRGRIERGADVVDVDASAAPLRDADDRVAGRVYVLRDVTREAQLDRAREEFINNAAHELRTPVTKVSGAAQLVALLARDEQVADAVRTVQAGVSGITQVTRRLLDYADVSSGYSTVSLEPVDLRRLLTDHVVVLRERHPDRTIARNLARDLPTVLTSEEWLVRLLDELVDNALKFTTGPVRILAERAPAGGARVTVRDRGEGMTPQQTALATELLRQVDGSSTREQGGLGLGLALVARITDRLDARLEIVSEPGQGTDVTVVLPAVPADAEPGGGA